MAGTWSIDELANAGPEHLQPDYVARYDRKAGSDAAEALELLRKYGLGDRSTLLDIGAGTGELAIAAARFCREVIAVDVSRAMLDFLRDRLSKASVPNVRCVEAGFISYRHDEEPVDFVYTRNALHHLPDFWKAIALDRVAGFVPPQGVLVIEDLIYDFQPSQADEIFTRWFAQAATDSAVGYTEQDFVEHIRSEHSTFRWLFEPLLDATGFDLAEVSFESSVYGTYVCVRRG